MRCTFCGVDTQMHNMAFQEDIWAANFTNIQLERKYHKKNQFWLCVIDISSKYA